MLRIVAWWAGTEGKPADTQVEVELNKEYLNIKASPQEIQVALTALQAGEMSFETWYNLLITGGWAREGIDAEAEMKAIQERKDKEPEPVIDPELSPGEGPKPPKKKTIRDAAGAIRYEIEEQG